MFFGGSVTNGYGASISDETSWRGKIGNWFKQEYPNADIKLTDASIGGGGK